MLNQLFFILMVKTLASSGEDTTIRIWNIDTLECTAILAEHSSWVLSIAAGKDGKTLISGSWDETIRIWDIRTGDCLQTLSNKPYANTNIRGAKGLTKSDKAALKALGAVEN